MIENLNWEDMMLIHRCIKDAINYRISSLNTIQGQQNIYEDALKRFMKERGNKYQQKQNVFEVGDIISDGKTTFRIDSIVDDNYVAPDGEVIPFYTAHRYFYIHKKYNSKPVEEKYDFSKMKPFTQVLARHGSDENGGVWLPYIFVEYRHTWKTTPFIMLNKLNEGFEQCVPFEGNEHLMGTIEPIPKKYKL